MVTTTAYYTDSRYRTYPGDGYDGVVRVSFGGYYATVAPCLVADYLPQLKYLLIEQNRYTDETLVTMRNLVAAIIRVEQPPDSKALFVSVRGTSSGNPR